MSSVVEIIAIGDEIVSGEITNTNASFLAQELWQQGLAVKYHTTVRDDERDIADCLIRACGRAGIVIVTGGLGPTMDDFTIEVAAKVFGAKLVEDAETLRRLHGFAQRRGRVLTENSKKQALVPEGAKIFANHVGTAPGIYYGHQGALFYFLPGVPAEMKDLFLRSVLPDILARQKRRPHFKIKYLKTFGAPEAELDHLLSDLAHDRTQIENARVGFRAHFPETTIKLSLWDEDEEAASEHLQRVVDLVLTRVGKYVYSFDRNATLEEVVVKELIAKKKTLAVAESCTGGLLADRITDVSGASEIFLGGVVAYANDLKQGFLGVSPETLAKYGEVSPQCAEEMVRGIQRQTGAQLCVSVTGIAGPTGGTKDKPVGTVHIATLFDGKVQNHAHDFAFPRRNFKILVTSVMLKSILARVS